MKNSILLSVNAVVLCALLLMLWNINLTLSGLAHLSAADQQLPLSTEEAANSDSINVEGSETELSQQNLALRNQLKNIIGKEIRQQLAAGLTQLPRADPVALEPSYQQEQAFQQSEQILYDIAGGSSWTPDLYQQFEDNLAQLPPQQSLALAKLQAKLISDGLMAPPLEAVGDDQP